MYLQRILILSCLFTVAISASFEWNFKKKSNKKTLTGEFAYTSSADGSIHMFWERSTNDDDEAIDHHLASPDGTVKKMPFIDLSDDSPFVGSLAAQVSNDGKYLILVFDGGFYDGHSKKKARTDDGLAKVIYLESSDGGITWTDPKLVSGRTEDGIARYNPSVYMEQSTGRIYVLYKRSLKTRTEEKNWFAVSIKEPGNSTFNNEILLPEVTQAHWSGIGQTIDKANSKEYLHVFGRVKAGDVVYSRSSDKGKTWSDFKGIATGKSKESKIQVAIDTQGAEGGLYVQYDDSYLSKLIWSNDHGENFDKVITVGESDHKTDLLYTCGNNGTGLLFSTHHARPVEHSFIKVAFVPSRPSNLLNLPYPFKDVDKGYMTQLAVHCRHVDGNYLVTYIGADNNFNVVWLARGTFKEV